MTTLLAAGLLFFFASGPVKGFGVTLSIGVVASMVSALVVARVLTDWAVRRLVRDSRGGPALGGTGRLRTWLVESGPFLMRRVGGWIGVAVAVGVVAVGGIVVRGLDLGVEFTGGRLLEFSTSQDVGVEQARTAVAEAGFPGAVVQTSSGTGAADNITVRTGQISNDEAVGIEESLARSGRRRHQGARRADRPHPRAGAAHQGADRVRDRDRRADGSTSRSGSAGRTPRRRCCRCRTWC